MGISTAQGAGPARSGTIVSGAGWLGFQYGYDTCRSSPDCATWLQSGCRPALAGREPAVFASIVDVAALADGRTPRRFRFQEGEPAGSIWGGVSLQFWTAGCTEITTARGRVAYDEPRATTFRIPAAAAWMTVAGYPDNVHLTWTLS